MRSSRIAALALSLAAFNTAAAGDFIFENNFDGAWISGLLRGPCTQHFGPESA